MPRTNTAVARGQSVCAFEKNVTKSRWNAENERETYETTEVCGHPAVRHSERTKGYKRITDHPYGGEDGTKTTVRFPKCGGCGEYIQKGDKYRFWNPRKRAKVIRCSNCPNPPRSFFTTSEIKATAWDIADDTAAGQCSTIEELQDLASDYAGQIQDLIDTIDEKIQNIEDGFGHRVPVCDELEDRKSEIENWMSEVEDAVSGFEAGGECETCGQDEDAHNMCDQGFFTETDGDECDNCKQTESDHACDEYIDAALEEARSALEDALGNCPE